MASNADTGSLPLPQPQALTARPFDFRRLVAAPLVIIAGIVIEVVAIMGKFEDKEK